MFKDLNCKMLVDQLDPDYYPIETGVPIPGELRPEESLNLPDNSLNYFQLLVEIVQN